MRLSLFVYMITQVIMPTTDLNQRVKRITGMSDAAIAELDNLGVRTEDDLRWTQFVDYPDTIPIVFRRKLESISQFLARGNTLEANTTMVGVQERVNLPPLPPGGLVPNPPGMGDPDRGAPKVYTDPLPEFSGEAVDYEEWERKAGATIKQTAYKGLLDNPATVGNPVEEARSKELFNMIFSCVAGGHALNATIEKVHDDNNGLECGYLAWKSLKDWYLDPTQVDSMIFYWERKLGDVVLDVDTSATEYINNFEMYV